MVYFGCIACVKIVGKLIDSDSMEDDYEHISSELLKWIYETIKLLENRRFATTFSCTNFIVVQELNDSEFQIPELTSWHARRAWEVQRVSHDRETAKVSLSVE